MTPSVIRRLAALAAFFAFIPLASSGLVLLLLPRGDGGWGRGRGFGRTVDFLGFARHDWGDFHHTVAIVFLIAAVVHLALNWKAIKRHLGLGREERGTVTRNYL